MPAQGALLAAAAAVAVAVAAAVFHLPPAFHLSWTPRGRFADMILANATIYTADAARPFADAMAVRGGRVLHVGSYDSVKELKGRRTYELNLSGNVVLPGFIDSHVHLIDGGLQLARLPLRGVRSKDDFINRVKEAVRGKHRGQWVLGGGWNSDFWGGDFPTAAWLDDISPDNPVWLSRMDGHTGVANSLAMKIAGINKNTNDPVGGTIMRTTEGDPTGLLVDAAMKLVFDMIQEVSIHERREALLRASRHALMRGVTTVVDVGSYFPGTSENQTWKDFSGSSSALFYEPYKGDPGNYGLQLIDMDILLNATLGSDESGLQVAIHAIGDKANDMLLGMRDKLVNLNGMKEHMKSD